MASMGNLRRNWPWLPVGVALVYVLLLLGQAKSLVQAIYLSADVSAAPMIAELSDQAPSGSEVVLGNFPWYEAYWFETLTRWAPAHRQLWEVAPYLFSLAGIACVAWSTWKVAGRWAGAMVAVALGCASGGLLTYQFAWSIHAAILFHGPLVGAFLVLCVARGGTIGRPAVHVPAAVALTLFTALGVASDRLTLVTAVVPLAVAGVAVAWLAGGSLRWPLALTAVGVAAGSLIVGLVVAALARDAGIRSAGFPIHLAQFGQLGTNVRLLFESLSYLGGGDFGGKEPDLSSMLELVCAGVVSLGALWAARYVRRTIVLPQVDPVRAAHVIFWATAGAVTTLSFLLSSLPVDKFSSRYVIVPLYAIPALLAVAVAADRGWRRAALVAGVGLVALSGVFSLARQDVQDNVGGYPTGVVSGPLGDLVQEEGLDHGYAGYWDAAPLTWQTKARALVYPIKPCVPPTPDQVYCRFPFHRIDSWYRPKRGVRTFLVVDPTQPDVQAPDPRFGRPERVEQIGQLEVRVYGYDIASRLGP
jgi:hypothetical protein